MRTWQVALLQFLVVVAATAVLAGVIHFPDSARRPMPPPTGLFFALLAAASVALIALAIAGVRSPRARTVVVVACSVFVWLLGFYALSFVWINTFGT